MPLEIEALLSDADVLSWYDDQCWWYVRLIFESWKFSQYPAHLPNDPERLMTLAGISRREPNRVKAWKERSKEVLKKFETTEDGAWIFHPKTLEVYVNQLAKWDAKRDAGSKGGLAKASKRVALLGSATSEPYTYKPITNSFHSLKEKKEFDSEEIADRIRKIGAPDGCFRDAASITVEQELAEQVIGGADPAEIFNAVCRIYRWTDNATYAPRLAEVIRRWREPQNLWERKAISGKVGDIPKSRTQLAIEENRRLEASDGFDGEINGSVVG